MKTMHVRDFLRGGYQKIDEPTLITKHGREIGTWIPPIQSFAYFRYLREKNGKPEEIAKSSSR